MKTLDPKEFNCDLESKLGVTISDTNVIILKGIIRKLSIEFQEEVGFIIQQTEDGFLFTLTDSSDEKGFKFKNSKVIEARRRGSVYGDMKNYSGALAGFLRRVLLGDNKSKSRSNRFVAKMISDRQFLLTKRLYRK